MNHLMIDIESLGGAPKGQLISIGAVLFSEDNPQIANKYWIIQNYCPDNMKRVIDKSTVVWWTQQSEQAREVFKKAEIAFLLPDALGALSKFILSHSVSTIWANGVDFDLEILQDCYKQMNMQIPWKYSRKCCMRSLRNIEYLSPELPKWKEYKEKDLSHNALEDAIAQAAYVHRFLQKVKNENSIPIVSVQQ